MQVDHVVEEHDKARTTQPDQKCENYKNAQLLMAVWLTESDGLDEPAPEPLAPLVYEFLGGIKLAPRLQYILHYNLIQS